MKYKVKLKSGNIVEVESKIPRFKGEIVTVQDDQITSEYHYDIRFQKKDDKAVHEFNLFTDVRKGPSKAIYKTCYDVTWMDIKEKEHRKVGGLDTIIEPIDSGEVKYIEENPDFLSFELKGKVLKGLYIAKKQAGDKWTFQKTNIARTSPISVLPDGSAFFTAEIDTKIDKKDNELELYSLPLKETREVPEEVEEESYSKILGKLDKIADKVSADKELEIEVKKKKLLALDKLIGGLQ